MHPAAKAFLILGLAAFVHADDQFFGVSVHDAYRGLEISSAPETQKWLNAQEQKTAAYFSALPDRQAWHESLQLLTSTGSLSLPKVIRSSGIVDVETLRLVHPPKTWAVSPDGQYATYALYPGHQDAGVLHVRNLRTARDEVDVLPWENYGDVAWSADSQGFYYLAISSGLSDTDRVAQATVRYHRVHQPVAQDMEIFPATQNPAHYLIPQTSSDGQWLFVSIEDGFAGTSLYARDLTVASTAFTLIFVSTAATATVTAWNHQFYLLTNAQAPHYAVWTSSGLGAPWRTLLKEERDSVWDSLSIFGQRLVLHQIRNASSHLVICTLAGTACQAVALPSIGSVEEMEGHPLSADFYFRFESFFAPPAIYKASVKTHQAVLWQSAQVPSVSKGTIERRWFKSKDGTPVPLWLLYNGTLGPHAQRPAILAGYGGFAVSMTPRYQAAIGAWLKAGGLYVIPMLRGGGEFGETWHAAGMRLQKQKTFDDAIGAAEFLITQGYTQPGQLAIQGGSNGGLTVAAVITQRPDLFRAAILKNPLTDMIRYPLFGEGPAWISEYGSPLQKDDFNALIAYSPYYRVTQGARYPAVLVLSADSDDRVHPLHARKFAAALQAATASGRPVLFKTLKNAGHEGPDSPAADLDEWTLRLLFLQHELQMPTH